MKLFDVASFDVIHIVKLSFVPTVCEFVHKMTSFSPLLAIGEFNTPSIKIINTEQTSSTETTGTTEKMESIFKELLLHESPVRLIKFNPVYNLVVSTD